MPDRPLSKTQLARVGRLLYGDKWKHPLAQDLRTSWWTVHRWAEGKLPVPDMVRLAILGIATLRFLADPSSKLVKTVAEIVAIPLIAE